MNESFDEQSLRTPAQRRQFETRPIGDILIEAAHHDPIGPPKPAPRLGEPEISPSPRRQPEGPTILDRILNEAAKGANRAINESGPVGLNPAGAEALRRLGVFPDVRRNSFVPSPLAIVLDAPRVLAESAVRTGATLADIGLIALDAILEGGISATGQTARELGQSQGMAKRLERDLRMTKEVLRRR
ncbi:MAG: hypothetical protein AAF967_13005 [Pseudomonadota bacterium]